jgi:non-heme chloroperoxidase
MRTHVVAGGGGVPIHVLETGDAAGVPILFIHGFSQCSLIWRRQLNSDLAARRRLLAMDLRGHGRSGKPRDAYGDSALWADDIHAVIEELGLDRPILCGWSYGPLVMLDYVRHYGEQRISGLHFVGGVTKLGSGEARAVLGAEFLSLVPGCLSDDAEESVRSLEALARLFFVEAITSEDAYLLLGCAVTTPPHVRRALFSRQLDNDDLLSKIRKPVLITQGTEDRVVLPIAVDQHKRRLPHAQIHIVPRTAHAPFWDAADEFNRRLAAFSERS